MFDKIILKPGESVEASSRNVSSGSIGWMGMGVNDAYDLYLLRVVGGNYLLVIFMKLQFIFEDSKNMRWTDAEKGLFTKDFQRAISNTWGRQLIKILASGNSISAECRFDVVIDQWCVTEHWEINVKKIKKGSFRQSYVNPITGKVSLDSEDLTPTNKGARSPQRGVVHEFGHMLGLPDEYEVGTKHEKDYQAVMNRGESIFSRHRMIYMWWLDRVLEKNGWK